MDHRPTSADAMRVAGELALGASPIAARPLGSGHIHATFVVDTDGGPRVVVQRLNAHVFADPGALMDNVVRVTEHLRARLRGHPDATRRALQVIPSRAGGALVDDADGGRWRGLAFIDGVTHDVVEGAAPAYQAAHAFGAFAAALEDLPGGPLHETIPAFHHTPARLAQLEAAVDADPVGRLAGCRAEVDAALARATLAAALSGQVAAGGLARRPVHNDTKVNNVILDAVSGEALCVIDLDTVMAGLAAYDMGELVRTSVSPTPEDETRLDRIHVRAEVLEAILVGYRTGAGATLSAAEVASLATGGALMTYENALRFLADHLAGDVYFPCHRPGHNLDRARAQLALLALLEDERGRMEGLLG